MRDLERELRELRVQWPATPDLAAAVAPRLERRRRRKRPRRRLLAAAVALLLGGVAAVEPARSAVLDLLGLGSVRVERREPSVAPGAGLGLGRPVTQAQAERLAGFRPRPPAALGRPDGVFFSGGPPSGGQVSYTYVPRAGIPESARTGVGVLVTEFAAAIQPFLGKSVGPGTRVKRFRIEGDPAIFISGAAHGAGFVAPGGDAHFEDQRLAGTTLLVERGDLLIRIEGELTRARATAIARSVGR